MVKSEGRTVLADTGLGHAVTNPGTVKYMFGGTEGPLLDELQSVGVQVGDIDTFFLTNLHLDHVGWNISRNGTGFVANVSQRPLRSSRVRLGRIQHASGLGDIRI